MASNLSTVKLAGIDTIVESALQLGRVPGAALALVSGSETVFAKGYGFRDLETKLPMTAQTPYPIASTTKAFNATLLGMLVDAGLLAWDAPVRTYLPDFRLGDPSVSAQVTVRDLITMRTGLPRHDWLWFDNPIERAELAKRVQYLAPTHGLRERFQYNNVTVTLAGHLAERVTGQAWEALVRERILDPLAMRNSGFATAEIDNATASYHETLARAVIRTQLIPEQLTAPSGGALHSTVEDMARWMSFNLCGGAVQGRQLIRPQTLQEIHSPQIPVGKELCGPSAEAVYAMGWFVDTYNGWPRISHGGYMHDVNSEVALFPRQGLGFVAFTNMGCQRLSRLLIEHTFDLIMDLQPVMSFADRIAQYEKGVVETRERNANVKRVAGTSPSHPLEDYAGTYLHPAYGRIEIQLGDAGLICKRNRLVVPLQHWHYDAWIGANTDLFLIHVPNPFERASRLLFETNVDGEIAALSLLVEPALGPTRFEKQARPQ